MKALDRKLLRDLRLMWSQALSIALVVASGVAGFITTFSAYDALSWSRDRYYAEARFAEVFADVRRAPLSLQAQLQALPGVAQLETSLTRVVQVELPEVSDPIMGRLIGVDLAAPPQINRVHLRSGRMLQASGSGALEVWVSEGFAMARGIHEGARLHALINGRREALLVVGIALSPEYIFAGLGGSPDIRGFGVFWMDRRALAAAYNMEGSFNHVAVRLAPQAQAQAVAERIDQLLEPYGALSATTRDAQMSHMILNSEIQEQRVLGTVLPSIFLAVAAFLLNVVLHRLIATQREQIAALKALGYTNRSIGLHYLKLMLVIVLVGLLLGIGLGAWLGKWFTTLYAEVFRFPELYYRLRLDTLAAALLITLGAAALATWFAMRSTVLMPVAEAMRPPMPGNFRASFIEAWGLRERFSPGTRMVLRNMQRRPLRTGLTIFGIAASMAVLISGTFWQDTIALLIHTQFQQVLRGDVSVSLVEPRLALVGENFARLPHVNATEGARSISVRLVHGPLQWRGAVQGRNADAQLHRIVDKDQRLHTPPQDGLLITDRLADHLQVQPGQLLRVEVQEGRRQVLELPVVGTVAELMGMGAYIERRSLNTLLLEGDVVNQLTLAVDRGYEDPLLVQLKSLPVVAGSFSKAVMLRNIEGVTVRNLLVFSTVLTLFATIIAVGVVYNQARIALAERAWELASLRVLGFTQREVSNLLLGELALDIALAIPLGLVAGYFLTHGIVSLIKTDEFFFPLVILPATYAYAALCVSLAGGVSALIVSRRIRQLDLVGVLKTRE